MLESTRFGFAARFALSGGGGGDFRAAFSGGGAGFGGAASDRRGLARPSCRRLALRLATTRGTNALLERKGRAPLFRDPRFRRPAADRQPAAAGPFRARNRAPPEPLYSLGHRGAGAPGGGWRGGRGARPRSARAGGRRLALAAGCEAAGIALLHSYRKPAHELRLAEFLRAARPPLRFALRPCCRRRSRSCRGRRPRWWTPTSVAVHRRLPVPGRRAWRRRRAPPST